MMNQQKVENETATLNLTPPSNLLIPHVHLGRETGANEDGNIDHIGDYTLSILLPLPAGYELTSDSSITHIENDVKVILQVDTATYSGVSIGSGYVKLDPKKLSITSKIEVSLSVPESLAETHDQIINIVHVKNAVPDILLPKSSPEWILNEIKPHVCLSDLFS